MGRSRRCSSTGGRKPRRHQDTKKGRGQEVHWPSSCLSAFVVLTVFRNRSTFMRHFLLLSFLLASTPLLAQQTGRGEAKRPQPPDIGVINDVDVCITELTEEKLNNPPKREIKFERVAEPLKRKLERPDPKLIEEKFAARFDL